MKNLIFISGTMGIGKTATSRELQRLLSNCVFLDGDWCWDASPFIVTDETKHMVLDNIAYLLSGFLKCSAYENIIFCWVMNEPDTGKDILGRLSSNQYRLHEFSLICSPDALSKRIAIDAAADKRDKDIFERSVIRLESYKSMDTHKIDVSDISAKRAAEMIMEQMR